MYELSVHLRADHIARCMELNSDDSDDVRVCKLYTATKRKKIAINIHAVEQMTSNKQMKVKVNIKPLMKTDTGTGSQNTLTVLSWLLAMPFVFICCLLFVCVFFSERETLFTTSHQNNITSFSSSQCA